MIKIDGGMSRFIFLVSDVSIFSVYLLLQMTFLQLLYLQDLDIHRCRCSFLQPLYLQGLDIHSCRCSFGAHRICNLLFFELADAFQPAYYI